MKYPKELVDKYGAKAGILMYITKNLSQIPQVDMIVKTPKESIDEALERADKFPILWPRIFRSSAVAELDGYEGIFPTKEIGGPDSWLYERNFPNLSNRERIKKVVAETKHYLEIIQASPRELKESEPGKHDNLPDDISVIIAEKSPSSIVGTYIKHPNEDDFYVISASIAESLNGYDPSHSAFTYRSKEGIRAFKGFSKEEVEKFSDKRVNKSLKKELEEIVSWHDKIISLPEIDDEWTYQIEFGLDPICLYQVRPFKKKQKANFTLKAENRLYPPLVIGITKEEGINVRLETNIWERHCNKEIINSEIHPSLFYDSLRNANKQEYVPNVKVNILTEAHGILAHQDISAIRKAEVSGLYSLNPPIDLEQESWYNIKSDGNNISIKKI